MTRYVLSGTLNPTQSSLSAAVHIVHDIDMCVFGCCVSERWYWVDADKNVRHISAPRADHYLSITVNCVYV